MKTLGTALAGAALALSVSFAFAQASTLTTDQINAILNLLQSFGASQSIITNVQLSLTGGTPTVTNSSVSGEGESGDNNNNSNGGDSNGNWHAIVPGWMGSTTLPTAINTNGQQQGPGACLTFNRDLSEGDQGGDVRSLQQMLSGDGLFTASTTGFFGPLTAHALAMWQDQNGIASSTNGGAVGPLTRGFFERRCGAGGSDNGRGNGGIPGEGGMMGSTTDNWHPLPPPPPATTTATTSQE